MSLSTLSSVFLFLAKEGTWDRKIAFEESIRNEIKSGPLLILILTKEARARKISEVYGTATRISIARKMYVLSLLCNRFSFILTKEK